MWTLLTGCLLSTFFNSQIVELFKNRLSNDNLSFRGILLGWFFQEYIREEFKFTGGKRFILESDFRNRLLTQSFVICRDLIIHPYLIISLELGTFYIISLGGVFILVVGYKSKFATFKNEIIKLVNTIELKTIKNYKYLLNKIFIFSYAYWKLTVKNIMLYSFIVLIIKQSLLKTYFWYDTLFIIKPIFVCLFVIFGFISFLYINYIIYLRLLYNFSKKWTFILKLLTTKLFFLIMIVEVYLTLFLYDLNLQNITTENFFKEMFFKNFVILYQTICLKQNSNLL